MEDSNILETYKNVALTLEGISVGTPTKDSWLRIFTGAAIAKCLEFNLASFGNTDNDTAFFNASGLRGICEDFIALKYFRDVIDPKDTQEILFAWAMKQMADGVEKQSIFFKSNRPQQPVISYSDKYKTMSKSNNTKLKSYRSKYGWAQNSPRIIDMADACSLRPLYDYLYSATSKSVHFSPHFFLRMGWGDTETDDPSFHFSTKNFAKYYVDFSRFYGTFLFINFCETFGDNLGISDKLIDFLIVLKEYLENIIRWPEIVTFEEMNLSPPNYGAIHSLMPLVKQLDSDDRREMVQVILTERNNEKISKMSAEEKRDLVNQFFGGQVPDKVASISDDKLDQILHGIGKKLIANIKPDIQAEDMAIFLSAIPAEELINYIEKMATNETSTEISNDVIVT